MPNVFEINYVAIDIALSAVIYAASGAAMGWGLNRFK